MNQITVAHPIRPKSGNGREWNPPRKLWEGKTANSVPVRPHPDRLEAIAREYRDHAATMRRLERIEG